MNAGQVIQARYELTELLGRGGMAEVWLARDSHLGRPVAIKFLARQLAEDPEFLVRFFSEAQEVARISHPNVVTVLDFGDHEDNPYLVMEAVGGGPLTELIGEPQPAERAAEIVAQAARAAGAAHALGVVHRDIKPGNILLDDEGVAKLADFGIAWSGHSERLTATGAAIGSPHYISPEQASGGIATPASDVYSLGIVLYELLAGVRPFEGDNITAIAIAHVEQEPAVPSTHVPGLPPAIDALVMRCLSKDPGARFGDGNELASALEGLDRFEPVTAAGAVVATSAPRPRWSTRRTAGAAVAAAVLLAVPVIAVLAGGDAPVARAGEEKTRLPNVGGLRLKKSPSPTASAGQVHATPRPTPTADKKRATAPAGPSQDDDDRRRPSEGEAEPEPSPEPTEPAGEPSPQPTDGRSPAP